MDDLNQELIETMATEESSLVSGIRERFFVG